MKKFKHIFNETYCANIYFIACAPKEYIQRIKLEFGLIPNVNLDSDGAKFEVYEKKGMAIGVVWLTDKTKLKTLAHECFHAAHWILSDRGVFLHDASEEAYAYLIEYLFGKIVARI